MRNRLPTVWALVPLRWEPAEPIRDSEGVGICGDILVTSSWPMHIETSWWLACTYPELFMYLHKVSCTEQTLPLQPTVHLGQSVTISVYCEWVILIGLEQVVGSACGWQGWQLRGVLILELVGWVAAPFLYLPIQGDGQSPQDMDGHGPPDVWAAGCFQWRDAGEEEGVLEY